MPLCPNCEDYEGEDLGKHWSYNKSCSAPEPTDYQKELFVGMLMGDGWIDSTNESPRLKVHMINKKFLEWFDEELGMFTTGVSLCQTAAEAFSSVKNSDKSATPTRVENYHDVYGLRSRSIPWFCTLESWYDSGKKRFPEDFGLTPEIARMWYISDGYLSIQDKGRGTAVICSSNEADRGNYLEGLFEHVGFDVNFSTKQLRFSVDKTPEFLNWIGDPPPGFGYKWEHDNFDEYRRLKEEAYDQ